MKNVDLNDVDNIDKPDSKSKLQRKKKKRKNHSQLGADFKSPDGKYGWVVCFAAGASNLCVLPALQQFGLIFRDRLAELQIPSSEITTIFNINQAATNFIGLANGFTFRRFTFRQVSLFGSIMVFVSLFFTSFADSFVKFLIIFSIIYGGGTGLVMSSNSLALNTYFKDKRRIATGISWTFTAFGPIIFPYLVTFLLQTFGTTGCVLMFSGIAMHSIVFALLLQPVLWHVEKRKPLKDPEQQLSRQLSEIECHYCQSLKRASKKSASILSSQYLYNADDKFIAGYEIIDPGTPMLAKSNDGWFSSTSAKRSLYSSRMSLTSKKINEMESYKASVQNLSIATSNRPSYVNLGNALSEKREKRAKDVRMEEKIEECPTELNPTEIPLITKNLSTNSFKDKTSPPTPMTSRNSFIHPPVNEKKYLKDNHSIISMRNQMSFRNRANTFNVEKEVLTQARSMLEEYVKADKEKSVNCNCDEMRLQHMQDLQNQDDDESNSADNNFTLWQKIFIFFDLDLLKDFSYLNIMIGITLANFTEINFSVLTPFVLNEFGLDNSQIAFCMSLLGTADIVCRFFTPMVAGYTGLENRTFFLIGVLNMAIGRIILAHLRSYWWALVAAFWIGFNKGLRTVFMALCIPSHVPLDRLPAATGLHLFFSGIVYTVLAPVVGFIRDGSDYVITLHCLNITTFLVAFSWTAEKYILRRRERKLRELDAAEN